jgi:hypothetical protein
VGPRAYQKTPRSNSEVDGSLRLYQLPDTKVVKAIRGSGSEISSVTVMMPNSSDIWVACGGLVSVEILPLRQCGCAVILNDPLQVKLFSLDAQQLIQSHENALAVIHLDENEGDIVNEACTTTHLPWFF